MLVRTLGADLAERLSRDLGGMSIQTQNGNSVYRHFRNQSIRRLAGDGMPIPQIANMMDLSVRMVRNIVGPSQGGVHCG
ncbi:MAG: hypothetical protein AB7F28_00230 [Candidatus Margulisiibacteriota bacterium]